MAKGGRIRTESMIDRLGKKPLTDGFDMWDKDYMLGALRLFQCKLEVAPPFEVAVCLDAVGDILCSIEEPEEALEHFQQAVDRYELIGKKLLASLMECKAAELQKDGGAEVALKKLDDKLVLFEGRMKEGKEGVELLGPEGKGQAGALGRLYLYRAELLGGLERHEEALSAVDTALLVGCDRVHNAHGTRGDVLAELGRTDEAIESYQAAIAARECYVGAYQSLVRAYRTDGRDEEALRMIEQAERYHPSAALIRDKAFILSNGGDDDGAVALLEKALAHPPQEETETSSGQSSSVGTLRKAKAAILADQGRLHEALAEVSGLIEGESDDDDAQQMRLDIFIALVRTHAEKNGKDVPSDLEDSIQEFLAAKPDASPDAVIDAILA